MYLPEDEEKKTGTVDEKTIPETVPSVPAIDVPDSFKRAFWCVAEYYACSKEEIALMKRAALADLENAIPCYMAMQREILGPALGVNERVRASIAKAAA